MAGPSNKALSWTLQAVCYAAFVAVVGYFATSPPYEHLPAGQALVKVSFQHAGERKEACHERTPEELAKLAPNMRSASVCARERVPLEVAIDLDGKPLFVATLPPRGLAKDGAATVYHRVAVPAGSHRLVARMRDAPAPEFGHVAERTVDLAPGRVLVIDFDAKEGGWVFRG
jgi:hypothetical protein